LDRLNLPAAQATTGEEALLSAEKLAVAIVLNLAREGVGVNSTGSYYAGEALEWSRLNFQKRREVMTAAVVTLLRKRAGGAVQPKAGNIAAVRIQGSDIGCVCDSIPASMGTAAARELVGQPFLSDPRQTENWSTSLYGPVHIIACQKNVSESQAVRQLGFPDAVVVSPPFGIFVADDVQKIQIAFLANCRDQTTTQAKVQSFLNWLNDQDEIKHLVQRARDRRKISDFIRDVRNKNALGHALAKIKTTRNRAR
jgi:hypothetical protein